MWKVFETINVYFVNRDWGIDRGTSLRYARDYWRNRDK